MSCSLCPHGGVCLAIYQDHKRINNIRDDYILSYITTYSGKDFDPINPDIEQIDLIDIAHALSLMCRGNGQVRHFYSVAQHCINCVEEARARGLSARVQLACLLHDASEAYITDVTRPIKPYLTNYLEIEERLQNIIYNHFISEPITTGEREQVQQIDDCLLVAEFQELMNKKVFDQEVTLKACLSFNPMNCSAVEQEFIRLFYALQDGDLESDSGKQGFTVVGIDGCKGTWLAVSLSDKGYDVRRFNTIEEVCGAYETADQMLIDMPIGLAESSTDVRPDTELRKRLKGKSSSVFNVPCRQAVYEADYESASNLNHAVLGSKLSRQSFAITPKMREIDLFLQQNPTWKNRLCESHPEYCFALLNGGNPVAEKKREPDGAMKRLDLLCRYESQSMLVIELFKQKYPFLATKTDDLLDALVLAVIGTIGLYNGFHTVPETPMQDQKGIAMQIVGAEVPRTR